MFPRDGGCATAAGGTPTLPEAARGGAELSWARGFMPKKGKCPPNIWRSFFIDFTKRPDFQWGYRGTRVLKRYSVTALQ